MKALIKTAVKNGYDMRVLNAVEAVNESQKNILFEEFENYFNGDAFKPEADDIREAPALVLIDSLLKEGCEICAYVPVAMDECKRRIGV